MPRGFGSKIKSTIEAKLTTVIDVKSKHSKWKYDPFVWNSGKRFVRREGREGFVISTSEKHWEYREMEPLEVSQAHRANRAAYMEKHSWMPL